MWPSIYDIHKITLTLRVQKNEKEGCKKIHQGNSNQKKTGVLILINNQNRLYIFK